MFEKNLKNYGKNRRSFRPQRVQLKKSANLKDVHRNLAEVSDPYTNMANRQSAAQLILKNRQSQSKLKRQNKREPKKQNSVNFYINIDKIKNLKISGRDKPKIQVNRQSQIKSNSLHHHNRKSMMLRNYVRDKKPNNFRSSHQSVSHSLSKIYQPNPYQPASIHQKSKMRYKTSNDDKQDHYKSQASVNKSYLLKRNNFKKTNQSQVKDKTFIDGYLKGKQLGRGGFSKVWQGFHFQTKVFYAIKEIDTQNKYQTHLTQIWFGNYFFENGKPKVEYMGEPGIDSLLTMYNYSIVDPRAFIVYQSCDGSLGSMLYDIYQEDGDIQGDEQNRLYMIKYKKLYNDLRKSTKFLKRFILQISQALNLLTKNKIVHSDLKTQNILIKRKIQHDPQCPYQFKLIDYGSSFQFQSLKQYKLATPEYMCPELLNFILYQNRKDHFSYMLDYVKDYSNVSAIDVWGLGSIVLQLIHGLPLWLTNPTRMMIKGSFQTKRGLFAVSDRSFSKILERQLYVVQNLQYFLNKNNNSCVALDQQIISVLKGMLNPNPHQRIRPNEIIRILN